MSQTCLRGRRPPGAERRGCRSGPSAARQRRVRGAVDCRRSKGRGSQAVAVTWERFARGARAVPPAPRSHPPGLAASEIDGSRVRARGVGGGDTGVGSMAAAAAPRPAGRVSRPLGSCGTPSPRPRSASGRGIDTYRKHGCNVTACGDQLATRRAVSVRDTRSRDARARRAPVRSTRSEGSRRRRGTGRIARS